MSAAEQASPALALATLPSAEAMASTARWHALRDVPLRLSVDIPLPPMSLRSLGALEPGQVLPSAIATADDLTVYIGGSPVCLARFEYMDGRMAIRMTRLLGALGNGAAIPATPAPSPAGAVP